MSSGKTENREIVPHSDPDPLKVFSQNKVPRSREPSSDRSNSDDESQSTQARERHNADGEEDALDNLDPWVCTALGYLDAKTRRKVVDDADLKGARNPNMVMWSRVKRVTSVDERIKMFIDINNLSEGVEDRLSTLDDQQKEDVMVSGLYINGASNPSGVAMQRINGVLRSRRETDKGMSGKGKEKQAETDTSLDRSHRRGDRSPSPQNNQQAPYSQTRRQRAEEFVRTHNLEHWVSEVLQHLSLYQRQQILQRSRQWLRVRNPSAAFMTLVREVCRFEELRAIFIAINCVNAAVEEDLCAMSKEQQEAVLDPGIYLQNTRNPSDVVRSRMKRVGSGLEAVPNKKRKA